MNRYICVDKLDKNDLIGKIKRHNFDSVILPSSELTENAIEGITNALPGVNIFADIKTFEGKSILDKFPDAKVVEVNNKNVYENGYSPLCPTNLDVRNAILEEAKRVSKLGLKGVVLSSYHYATIWDKPEPKIYDTCYCDRCLKLFQDLLGEEIEGESLEDKFLHIDGSYYHEWLQFKASNIASFGKSVREIVKGSDDKIELSFFAVPWEDKEYGASIKRILGQDYLKLAEVFDSFIPMLYYVRTGKDIEWLKEKIQYFWEVGLPFTPIIDGPSDTDQFKLAIEVCSSSPSSGICIMDSPSLDSVDGV